MRIAARAAGRSGASPLLLLVLLFLGCGGGPDWPTPVSGDPNLEVYDTTIRYIHRFYDPGPGLDLPAAWCVAVGRRSTVPLGEARRDERWHPGEALLRRLADLRPRVVPVTDCRWDSDLVEIYIPTQERAVAMSVSRPVYGTPESARVQVTTRESDRYRGSFDCRLKQSTDEWEILDCLRSGSG